LPEFVVLCIALTIISIGQVYSQQLDPGSSGTLYLLAFPDTTTNLVDPRFPNRVADTLLLLIYSNVDNEAIISGPSGYSDTVKLNRGVFKQVYLNDKKNPASPIITDSVNRPQRTTFRVESRLPVIVYCYFVTKFGAEAWTPLPVSAWGKEYTVAASPGEVVRDLVPGTNALYATERKAAPAEVLVIAALDNTQIIFNSPRSYLWDPPTSLASVTLNKGETFQLQSYVDTLTANDSLPQRDISGVRIISSKPIGVISGNTRARLDGLNTGLAGNSVKGPYFEWMSPSENLGREFVFLPIWDNRRISGIPGERIEEKRQGERIRFNGICADTTRITSYDSTGTTLFRVPRSEVYEERQRVPIPRLFIADTCTQVMVSSEPVLIDDGEAGTAPRIGHKYSSFAGCMVELVPREQWTSFAPYLAPEHPGRMEHFVNIVADSADSKDIYNQYGNRVVFNRGAIPGTDLVWGTMNVSPGVSNFFFGVDGARFSAVAYGLWQGSEIFRPTSTRKKEPGDEPADDARTDDARTDEGAMPLGPAEYEENVALSYGYALAPRRLAFVENDSLDIRMTPGDCSTYYLTVRTVGLTRSGLRSIYLADSSTNTRLTHPSANWQAELVGASSAEVTVVPINRRKKSHGAVIVVDRSGKSYEFPFTIEPIVLYYRETPSVTYPITPANTAHDTIVTVINGSRVNMTIYGVEIHPFNIGFRFINTTTPLPIVLIPGDSAGIIVRFLGDSAGKSFAGEIWTFDFCDTFKLGLSARTTPAVGEVRSGPNRFEGYRIEGVGTRLMDNRREIIFSLGRGGDVTLALHDLTGNLLSSEEIGYRESGSQRVEWDASMLPSGTYFLEVLCNGWVGTTTVVIVR
jgi:hypothetical protein